MSDPGVAIADGTRHSSTLPASLKQPDIGLSLLHDAHQIGMEFGYDDSERDLRRLPVDEDLMEVLMEGDRVTAEVLHSPLRPELAPLLSKDEASSITEDSDSSGLSSPHALGNEDARSVVRSEGSHLTKLAVPMLLTLIAETVADTSLSMLIGHTSIGADTKVLAALTLTNMYPSMLLSAIYYGVSSAVDTLCAQAFGGKKLTELWLFVQAGSLLSVACLPVLVAITLSAAPVLDAMGQDHTIIETGKPILITIALSLPSTIAYTLGSSALNAQNTVVPCTIASFVGWAISTPLAWCLAFYTRLGYVGIALQPPISYTIRAAIVFYAVVTSEGFVHWPGWQPRAAAKLAQKMTKLAGAGVLMVGCSMAGITIFSIIGGMLPDAATLVTASGIFLSMLMFGMVPENAIAGAAAVRIGNALGRGQAKRAVIIMLMTTGANAFIGIVEMLVAIAVAKPFASIFTTDSATVALAAQMIRQLSPMFVAAGFYASAQAALQACGKQLACAVMGFVTIVAIGLPIGLWFAISLDGGIVGLWFGNIVGYVLCILLEYAWMWRLDWAAVARDVSHRTHVEWSGSSLGAAAA